MERPTSGRYPTALSLLALFFALRVLGQVLVAFFHVTWLPPMAEWYSGLLPYSVLLAAQIAILLVMARIGLDLSRGQGFFARPRRILGRPLTWFSYIYFASMATRYVITMALHPERRWLGGTIPIAFHWVLAAYLYTLSHYHARQQLNR